MKKRALIFLCTAFVITISLIACFSKGTPKKAYREENITIRVAGDENHPPYEYIDQAGNYKGFNVDIMNALSIELGIDIEFLPMKWSDAVEALERKEVDAIQGITKTEERQKKFLFTAPTAINSQAIFVMKDTSIVSGLEDLAGLRLALQAGDVNYEKMLNIPGSIILPKKNQEEAIKALLNGEADAYIGNRLTGLFYLQKNKKTDLVKTVGDHMEKSEYGIATYIGNEELLDLFNEGLEILRQNGTYDKIYEKWFGKTIISEENLIKRYMDEIIISSTVVILVLALFIIWNKELKREVQKRTLELENANKELLLQQEKIHNLAYYDSITLLPNRVFLIEILERYLNKAKEENRKLAILNIDLDRFKHINDTLGHNIGDSILKLVGERIRKSIHKDNFIARVGGDEFIILIDDMGDKETAIDIANKVIKQFNKPFEIQGHNLFLTASIGISIYPEGGETADDLIKNSDIAMYVAKDGGGNSYYVYHRQLSEKQMDNLIIVSQLRQAITNNELVLFYQPIMDAASGEMVGMEALLRWNKPGDGMVGPQIFISLAEETGLIIPIGQWVLKTACTQNKKWIDAGYPPRRMFVNISGRQFQQKDFFESILNILEETGLDPSYLGIEITETVIIQDINYTIEIFKKLNKIGISIAIDDFGTGYSNFNYLKEMKVDGLKIDRSFISEISSDSKKRAITETIILLAHQLGLTVTAEGVETEDQLEFLKESNCCKAQGYYYSKPIPAEEFEKFLEAPIGLKN